MQYAGKIKKYLRRSADELIFSTELAKKYSLRDAAVVLAAKVDIQKSVRCKNLETPAMKRRLMYKHKVMSRYFREEFREFIRRYDFEKEIPEADPADADTIWLLWWQGEENAPAIVRTCIESVRRHAGSHPVVVLSEKNFRDYVSVPDWVTERLHAGKISITHVSDIIRISLLAEKGGLWLDATMFCTGSLANGFAYPIWSTHRPDYLHLSPACGRFANYALRAGGEGRRSFSIIRDILLHYWETTERMNDYLFLDYLILLAQRADPRTRELFKEIPDNNPRCDDLLINFGEAYDAEKWEEMKRDTQLFKLTWKLNYRDEEQGNITFCGMMRRGELK